LQSNDIQPRFGGIPRTAPKVGVGRFGEARISEGSFAGLGADTGEVWRGKGKKKRAKAGEGGSGFSLFDPEPHVAGFGSIEGDRGKLRGQFSSFSYDKRTKTCLNGYCLFVCCPRNGHGKPRWGGRRVQATKIDHKIFGPDFAGFVSFFYKKPGDYGDKRRAVMVEGAISQRLRLDFLPDAAWSGGAGGDLLFEWNDREKHFHSVFFSAPMGNRGDAVHESLHGHSRRVDPSLRKTFNRKVDRKTGREGLPSFWSPTPSRGIPGGGAAA